MAGLIPPEPDDDIKRRGHYLEPAIATWFADQHPDWQIDSTGTWVHEERPWQAASPDRVVTKPAEPTALLELKTSDLPHEWGEPGTDAIPVGYRAQVMWQMDTVGVHSCHVGVLTAYLAFEEYVVTYDEAEAAFLREQAAAFMDSLPSGKHPRRPDLDGHSATYQAMRELHPDIDGSDVEIDPDLAALYRDAIAAEKDAKTAKAEATSLVCDVVGTGRRAVCAGETVAIRMPGRNGAPPYLKASPARKPAPTNVKEKAA
jgi:hypothetical protein